MPRIAPSDAFANAELGDLGQGDRINLGVAAIMTRRPEVAQVPEAFRADSDAPVAPWVSGAVVASG